MPAAALMIALTPHMAQLAHAVEDHIERSASPAAAAASASAGGSHSPSRVTFSVERRPPGFAPARHTSCTVVAEIVVRGVLDPATAAATGTAPGPFEQLIWSRRFKVGKAAREGETILEHRVVTVPVPEELFRYAERYDDLVAPEGDAERGESRRMRKLRKQVERHAFKVAPVPDPPAEAGYDDDGDDYQQQHKQRRGAPAMHPKKSDLYAQEELDAQFAVVDQLPDGCTFHLMCALEIVRDTQRAGEDPYLMRRGAYETAIDPAALLAADSSLLPLEMFAPFVEETGGRAVDGSSSPSASAVDIVAFASVFAVVGDQLAAATHGDESNPSLVSSFLALALAAQYDHLVFNVFRPELSLYRQGLQMALSRRGLSSGSPPTAAAVPTAARQQPQPQPQVQQQQQHSSPSPSRPPPPERDAAFVAQRQQQQQPREQPTAVSAAPVAPAHRQQVLPAFAAARRSQQQQDPQEVEERGPRSPSTRGAALGESVAPAAVQQQQTLPSRRAVLRRDEDAERERSYLQPATVPRSSASAAAQRAPSGGSINAAASSSRADVLQSILRKKQPQQLARDDNDEW